MWVAVISHTPVWVWLLLMYLLYRGYKGMAEQRVECRSLLLFPVALILFALDELYGKSALLVGIWLLAVLVGTLLGIYLFGQQIERAYRDQLGALCLSGHVNLMIVLMGLFIGHYFVSVMLVLHPNWYWNAAKISLTGIGCGIFLFRNWKLFLQFQSTRCLTENSALK